MHLVSGQDLAQWRKTAIQSAISANISPEEVDWLLLEISLLDRLSLHLKSYLSCPAIPVKYSLAQLSDLWQRRLQDKIPLQYLVGVTPWRDFSLKVSPSVLIPRPETEEIIDIAAQAVENCSKSPLKLGIWVDLGTGSGAIALGLAQVFPQSQIYAVDCSQKALEIAQENAIKAGLEKKIQFYCGNWWIPLQFLQGNISGMVSNPPYIPSGLIETLQPEVAKYEPKIALDGGKDGLTAIRHLVDTAPLYLKSGGIWLIEMMNDQAEKVVNLLKKNGNYDLIKVVKDISGQSRFILAYRR